MLVRNGRRLETTLLVSRQALVRPARLYSSPSKRRDAAASALAYQSPPPADDLLPSFASSSSGYKSSVSSDLNEFLKRGVPHTILPSPRPDGKSSNDNTGADNFWFVDTPTQDSLGIMNACLNDLHDVKRAKMVFDLMRDKIGGNPMLETRVYNSMLEAFVKMAHKESNDWRYWIDSAWELYGNMESGKESAKPNEGTYAVMLQAWHRYCSLDPELTVYNPRIMLTSMLERQVQPQLVVSDRVFTSSEEASEIIRLLSKTAVELNFPRIVSQLGQAEAIGTSTKKDPLDNIPEAIPVLRRVIKKRDTASMLDAEGNEVTPEATPVDSKSEDGQLVESTEIPFNLDNLRRHLADVNFARRVLPEDVTARQKLLEESVYDVAVNRLKHESEVFADLGVSGGKVRDADLRRWMWEWHNKLSDRLQDEIHNISILEANGRNKAGNLSPYLHLVKASRLSLITIMEIMQMNGASRISEGLKTTRVLIQIGRAVEMEYKAQMAKKNNIVFPVASSPASKNGSHFSNMGYNFLLERRVAAAKYMEEGEVWTATWTQAIRAKIGGILMECLMDAAMVERTRTDPETGETQKELQPAFHHTYEHVRGQKLGVIKLNPIVAQRLQQDNVRETLHPRHLPMLVRPKAWVNHNDGGYIYNKTTAMRYKDSVEQQSYLKHASDQGNLELVYAGLDVLGSTPWMINDKIFHTVLKVWNSGQRLGKVPPVVYDVAEPEPPSNPSDVREKTLYAARVKEWNHGKANNHSDRCNVNYKIEIARAFLGDTFYQPHNVDFRGRAYPIPPHLNHIGDDLSRGLLMFAEAKPLGERGLRWLKIQLAGLYGYDKASFDDREKWVGEHLEEIYDSALNPTEGRKWWTQADDPWQCLAVCIDLHAALESPNPTEYMSKIPVHQDGTCNGLQHYAALGGDAVGAAQVNLASGEKPSDVYSFVGGMAEVIIAKDAEGGNKYAQILTGKISRKMVKQTVMTTVYGVTFIGAREQIEKQLKAAGWIPYEDVWGASSYLAKVVLGCIGDLFKGATSIQSWFSLCASLISRSIPGDRLPELLSEHRSTLVLDKNTGSVPLEKLKKEEMSSVVWTTPLGLPIVQPYRKAKRKQIMTALQTVFIEDPNSPAGVNAGKQASAFPPNFIHSLDATHMMLTALECSTQNLTFAAVHDSYWTHACSVDAMSAVIRDTFIALHSSDVLEKLREEFMERYKDHKISLLYLKNGTLAKKLRAAGSKINVTPEQAANLPGMTHLLNIVDPDAAETAKISAVPIAPGEVAVSLEETKKFVDQLQFPEADSESEEAPEVVEDEGEDDGETKPRKQSRMSSDEISEQLRGKFINLVELLPPLPAKGTFNVDDIKKSAYFFS